MLTRLPNKEHFFLYLTRQLTPVRFSLQMKAEANKPPSPLWIQDCGAQNRSETRFCVVFFEPLSRPWRVWRNCMRWTSFVKEMTSMLLEKHCSAPVSTTCWQQTLLIGRIEIFRSPGQSLGISIVGGRNNDRQQQIRLENGEVVQVRVSTFLRELPRSGNQKKQTLSVSKAYLAKKISHHYPGFLKRVRCRGEFYKNSAIILNLRKGTCWISKGFLLFQEQTQVHSQQTRGGRNISDTKKFRNVASVAYWRSVHAKEEKQTWTWKFVIFRILF